MPTFSRFYRLLLLFCLFFSAWPLNGQKTYTPEWSSLDTRPVPEWWLDAKFGIFIHWGMYSVPGFVTKGNYAEWYQYYLDRNAFSGEVRRFHQANYGNRSYYDLADDFHAELYNPDEWANLFEKAGAKYVVLTSKHHDGFCLWPDPKSAQTWGFPWNATVRGPKRDLMGDLFAALNKTSVKPGFYFSLYEWFNPIWKKDPKRYAEEHSFPQLYDAVNRYKPWVVWGDGEWDAHSDIWQSRKFLAWLYNESPVKEYVVPNDRWGSDVRFKHAGTYTPEYQPDMDFENHAWEESRGMGFSYGYNRMEDAWDYNSAQSLILHLIDKVSRGGNFLLDIGPDAHGKIPPIMQDRLLEIGRWLAANGEAIYNTRRWQRPCQWSEGNRVFKPELVDGWKTGGDALLKQTIDPEPGFAVKEAFFTYNPKSNHLYAILPQYPENRQFLLKGIKLSASNVVTLPATGQVVRAEPAGEDTRLYLPEYHPNKFKAPYAYALKIANYGKFVAKPEVQVRYDASTMRATVTIHTAPEDAEIRYTTDGSEPGGNSMLYTGPIQSDRQMSIRAKAFKQGWVNSAVASEEVLQYPLQKAIKPQKKPKPGLQLRLTGNIEKFSVDNVLKAPAKATSIVLQIEPDSSCMRGACGMVWQGNLSIPQTGGYVFWTESDDGSLLSIDGMPIVNNGGDHGMTEKSGAALLEKGWHTFQLVYYNSSGGGGLKVRYAPVNGAPKALEAALLGH